jgi:hypothetical protein
LYKSRSRASSRERAKFPTLPLDESKSRPQAGKGNALAMLTRPCTCQTLFIPSIAIEGMKKSVAQRHRRSRPFGRLQLERWIVNW